MVLQYCSGKNLREHLKEEYAIKSDWSYKIQMAKEIATGLQYIHAENLVHCDLNSKNIMHHNGRFVIIDFGSSLSLKNQTEPTLKVTEENIAYVDPKFFDLTRKDHKYDQSFDIYSLGVIFWEISSGRLPFSDRLELKDTKQLKTFLALENRENPINLTPVDYKELYCDSWNPDPKKRPLIDEVINRLNDIEFNCEYRDSNYIPEICFGNSFRNRIRPTSINVACLEVAKGLPPNLYIFLSLGEISIGRGNSNDVIIKDQEIAKKHARISVNNGNVKIEKFESDYDIFVNVEKLEFHTPRLLIKGDVISMGRSEFQYLPNDEYISRMDKSLPIYNKIYFSKKLEDEFKSVKEENKLDLCLLFFDVDDFKSINDHYDHTAGDYVLKELVNLIRNNHVRPVDTFARFGGDEFTILLKDADINLAVKTAEGIRGSIEIHSFIYNKIKLPITLSIGVSEMNSSVETYKDLLLHADNALLEAKKGGRNRVIIWNNKPNSTPKSENYPRESPNKSEAESYHTESLVSSSIKDISTYSTMDEEIDVTIIKLNSENKETVCSMYLVSNKTLNSIRTKLEEYDDDFRMGTNCRFVRKKKNLVQKILRKEESKLNLSQIIETHDDCHFLYIKESAEFDLLKLKDEKGFKFCTNGSIENAKKKAFKIIINKIKPPSDSGISHKDNTYKCDHEFRTDCKRCLIIDGKVSDALEWFCSSLKLPPINSEQFTNHLCEWWPKKEIKFSKNSDIIATEEFVKDVKAALESNEDIIKQLRKVSEDYGHFYAYHLILGGAIVKSNSHVKNSVGQDIKNMQNFHNDNTDVSTSVNVIGGNKNKYSEDNIKSWDESLENESTWKIIGYNDIYPLFELLEEDLQKKVLSALGHRILKAGTKDINFDLKENSPYIHNLSSHIKEIEGNVHSYQIFASIMSKCDKILFSAHIDFLNKDKNIPVIVVHNIEREYSSSTTHCSIKLGWIIVGPLTNFDFKVQFPLVFKSMKQSMKHMKSLKGDHITVGINNYNPCILGICAVEANSQTGSMSNNDSTRKESTEITQFDITYDPKETEIVVGTHFSTYKGSACLFVYNIKDIEMPVDETILQNLALYTCVIDIDNHDKFDFGQKNVIWHRLEQEKISYANFESMKSSKKVSDNDLILVSQQFKNCPACNHFGFVNVNSNNSKVIYKSLNSKPLNSAEDIAYLLFSLVNNPKN
ncbi:kinase-like protein [Gigaspora margarita]|uniref:Kinase-like protein n=2 Tax=Gigaspora margarita TaxID=4874 RepID=A0A8H4AAR8_GIGMA|nr:kinase-like protein [Gigaspora margarita]